ncbi:hypothetical protein G7046_g309 [Stylonectria norvegica]|nr:hypothetical protein G7046_g309 [Stylonectria norvegica]
MDHLSPSHGRLSANVNLLKRANSGAGCPPVRARASPNLQVSIPLHLPIRKILPVVAVLLTVLTLPGQLGALLDAVRGIMTRALEETLARWKETQIQAGTLAELQKAVRYNGPSSPCLTGCRSVCWKTFLLSRESTETSWSQFLYHGRTLYAEQRDHFLKFIKRPEALAELTVDPLADDPDSPWNTVRQDEIIRAEINQDVQRLPDDVSYHEDKTQALILDILFVYCKLNPDRGGYRQGMHELLAPIVHAVQQDAVDRSTITPDLGVDESMLQMLDSDFIEHDAYILFSQVMNHAQAFYEVKDTAVGSEHASAGPKFQEQSSAIVERSRFIHEVCLHKVDPELAAHLTNIEILPQIFLIRWIRLLFSREFPLQDFLVLWDTIFAIDPTLDLIDLICVAMLIRIRWDLLQADYSVCLQLLLKYPPPSHPHGPHTFVDDALYLRGHLTPSGGASLIMKYTGKMPTTPAPTDGTKPTAPNLRGFNSFRQRGFGAKPPLPSPSKFIQQQGGMEALFQKGAKGVLERGERLGINQAVRDAMGEIKRNLNEARYSSQSPRQALREEDPARGLAALERRNRQLAIMLDETVSSLKAISASNIDDQAKSLEIIEIAAAKVQFVKIYLEDSSMEVPMLDSPPPEDNPKAAPAAREDAESGTDAKVSTNSTSLATPEIEIAALKLVDENTQLTPEILPSPNPDAMDTSSDNPTAAPAPNAATLNVRPLAPIPTRSTLAQSSFSWMLEPDESTPKSPPAASSKSPTSQQHKKRISNSASRERNAFLFGEVTANIEGRAPLTSDEIFGLEPIRKSKDIEKNVEKDVEEDVEE